MDRERTENVREDFRFGKEIQNIANRFRRLGDENLQKENVTVSQLRVISYISRNGEGKEVYQKDLEEQFGIRRSSVTSLLQNMEKRGILERHGSSLDARIKIISLTEKGKKLDENLKTYINTLEEASVRGFSPSEKEQFCSFLTRMLANLETMERSRI